MIISMLYKKLNALPSVRNEVGSIRKLVAELDCLFGSLENLGKKLDDENFVSIIQNKLPNNVVVLIEMTKPVEEAWTTKSFRKHLSDYVTRIERASKVCSSKGFNHDAFEYTADSLLALRA